MTTLEWRVIPWAPAYQVSSLGNVQKRVNIATPSRRQIRPIKLKMATSGYYYVAVNGRNHFVHRLVYEIFCGPLVPGLVICHRDGSRLNNVPGNLLQATQRENIAHKIIHGTHQAGEKHGCATITDAQALAIHGALSAAPRSRTGRLRRGAAMDIAARVGSSLWVVHRMSQGRTWRHLK
jgi:hypothetical protein